jgi:ABC-type nitrate/sulfonate/bicarbonate transport system permease component
MAQTWVLIGLILAMVVGLGFAIWIGFNLLKKTK